MTDDVGTEHFAHNLSYFFTIINEEFHQLKIFNDSAEMSWTSNHKEMEDLLAMVLKKTPRDLVKKPPQELINILELTQHKFPNLHRKSLVVSIYSHFEQSLAALCYLISDTFEYTVEPQHLKDKGITRSFLFLELVAKFNLSRVKKLPEWEFLSGLARLRNNINHNGGKILISASTDEKLDRKLSLFIEKNKYITLSPHSNRHTRKHEILLEASFINDAIEKLSTILGELELELAALLITELHSDEDRDH